MPHADPELERVIPPKVGPVTLRTMSTTIDGWWSLNGDQVEIEHRVELAGATVAFGMGRRQFLIATSTAYRVPGVSSGRLLAILGRRQFPDGRLPSPTLTQAGRTIYTWQGEGDLDPRDIAVLAVDGALVAIAVPRQHIASAVDDVAKRLEDI